VQKGKVGLYANPVHRPKDADPETLHLAVAPRVETSREMKQPGCRKRRSANLVVLALRVWLRNSRTFRHWKKPSGVCRSRRRQKITHGVLRIGAAAVTAVVLAAAELGAGCQC
jgi:hypothetical protein